MRAKFPLEYEIWIGRSESLHFLGPGFPRISLPTTLRITAQQMAGRLTRGLGNAKECPLMGLEWPSWDRQQETLLHMGAIFLKVSLKFSVYVFFSSGEDCLIVGGLQREGSLPLHQSEEVSLFLVERRQDG